MKLAVAMDHANGSLYRYVAPSTTECELDSLRRVVCSLAVEAGAEAVVVRLQDFEWAAKEFRAENVILGLADGEVSGLPKAWRTIQALGTSPRTIKCGLFLCNHTSDGNELETVLRDLANDELRCGGWIIEPYFESKYLPRQREDFIRQIAKSEFVRSFKLDIDADDGVLKMYSKATGQKPWYARSAGRDYMDFEERLRGAMLDGCHGSVAGAALWKEAFASAIGASLLPKHIIQITERIAALKDLITRYSLRVQ